MLIGLGCFNTSKHLETRKKRATWPAAFHFESKILCISIWISMKLQSWNKMLSELLKGILITCKQLSFYLTSHNKCCSVTRCYILPYIFTCALEMEWSQWLKGLAACLFSSLVNRYMNWNLLVNITGFHTAGPISIATVGFVVEHSSLIHLIYLPNPMRIKDPTTMINVCRVSV